MSSQGIMSSKKASNDPGLCPVVQMSSQGIMSRKKVSNNPGLCPVGGQKHNLGIQTGSHNLILKPVVGYYQDLTTEPKKPTNV